MKIPEHDIIECKWLIARATFAAMPREEERAAAAQELVKELRELSGLHGVQIDAQTVRVPNGGTTTYRYENGRFLLSREGQSFDAPVQYDAGLKMFVGPEIAGAPPGRNGQRPRVTAMVALMRALLGDGVELPR